MILARNSITVSWVRDIVSTYRFYKLQSSTAAAPAKPTTNTVPPSGWSKTEPAYTDGSTNSLYTVELTNYTDNTFDYSDVSLSSSYEAAKTAYNKALSAVETADGAKEAVEAYINPIASKRYTGVTASANNDPNAYLYFGFVKPSSYTVPWKIRYRIKAAVGNVAEGLQTSEVMINGVKSTYLAYQTYNTILNTTYRPLYAHMYFPCTQGGIAGGYGHLIGIRLHSSYNPATAANARTVDIDILEMENCTFELADSMFLFANAPGTGTVNYVAASSRVSFDGTTQGYTETGDRNTNTLENVVSYFAGKTGAVGIWAGGLFMKDGEGTYQSICTAEDGTVTNASSGAGARTLNKTKKANPNGFEIGSPVWYSTTSYNKGTNIAGNQVVYCNTTVTDARYAFNVERAAGSLTPYEKIYLSGTVRNGLYYLDDVWWTQAPDDAERVYVLVGACYDCTTSNVRFVLYEQNIWYRYVDGKLADYSNNLAELAQETADKKNAVFYQASQPPAAGRKEYDVWYDTDDDNKMYYWDGSAWTAKQFGGSALGDNCIAARHIVAHSITAQEITAENLVGANGWINLAQGTFNYGDKLVWDGNELAVTGTVNTGNITATGGKIGGISVTDHGLGVTKQAVVNSVLYNFDTVIRAAEDNDRVIEVVRHTPGNTDYASQFYVRYDGYLYAENANLKGSITATSITAQNMYYLHDSAGTKKAVIASSDLEFRDDAPTVNIGTDFFYVNIKNSLFCNGQLTVGSNGAGSLWCGNFYGGGIEAVNGSVNASSVTVTGSWNFRAVDLSNGAQPGFYCENSGRKGAFYVSSGNTLGLYDSTNSAWVIYSDTSQNVTIPHNTTITGSGGADTRVKVKNGTNTVALAANSNAGVYHDSDVGSKTAKWLISISTSGTVTANTSDVRYKDVHGVMSGEEAYTLLKNVDVIDFTYKEDTNRVYQNGFAAQQLRDVLAKNGIGYRPYLIIEHTAQEDTDYIYDINTPETDDIIYSVDYSRFTPVLWKGWQIHEEAVAGLDLRITSAESREEALQNELQEAFDRIAKLEKEIELLKTA